MSESSSISPVYRRPSKGVKALVAGATGVAGQSLVDALVEQGWDVVALSRSIDRDPRPEVTALPIDLNDRQMVTDALQPHRITHLFYAVQYRDQIARSTKVTNLKKLRRQLHFAGRCMPLLGIIPGAKSAIYRRVAQESGAGDPTGKNLRFFSNLIEVLESESHDLQHVAIVTGGKHYGMHLGPALYPGYRSEYREDDPRAPGPNWYYQIEDFIEERHPSWGWTIFRPSFIVGHARNAPYNLGTTIATYASLRKARGEPLIFFGDRQNRELRWDISGATQMAEMMIWSTHVEGARGQAFNCTTGTPFTWKELWPQIAEWFDLEPVFTDDGFPVRPFFEENRDLWDQLVEAHSLQPFSLKSLCSDDFVDRAMTMNWEACYSMDKAQRAGFPLTHSPQAIFETLFERLVADRVIPNPRSDSSEKSR